ncbi:VanZ family protein [Anaerorhabdus furcosa]|uniref:VanZ like family protein n=1 Tax=Anaerorhabdus furcosa TaxID=118967 RepID=A0A1T4K6V1_9FIRM|nr:VanZ family protein [Anaerorhabdus furcosa]SJZ38141.1 VanZ like family protein [Anaerorhabdus furcosa]
MKFIRSNCWVLVILMICFIFMNSLTPAVSSKALSSDITNIILNGFNSIHVQMDYDFLHLMIRKSAHFTEYAILGILIMYAVKTKPLFQSSVVNFTVFFLVPITDELIQKFTPGRSCEIGDMFIDASGMIVGCLLVLGVIHFLLDKKK